MSNKIKAVLCGLLLAVGITFVAASPAQASWSWVLTGNIGMATDVDGNGSRQSDSGPIGACQPVPWNDSISSIINRTSTTAVFWWGAGCNGNTFEVPPNTTVNYVGWWDNDEFTSYCIGDYHHTVPDATNSCHRWQHIS